ncbi:MAG: hypothetical protein E6L05_01695 [Thaumarchaeota archaeon]|nr:MAG: hypothetical protein E6L05_01695 [Nitrososphaerota archaeon]
MFRYHEMLENKSTLFSIVIFVVVGLLAIPVILPHISHEFQVFHILLHLVGISIAVFLSIISALAYSKTRTRRLLFTMIAFSIFVASEAFSVIDAAWQYTYYLGEFSADELGHILMISTLGMFALSVFRRD